MDKPADKSSKSGGEYVTIYFWSKGGSFDVGHISLEFHDGTYLSYVPDTTRGFEYISTRRDVPGIEGKGIHIKRHNPIDGRKLADDLKSYGPKPETLTINKNLDFSAMLESARFRYLCLDASGELVQGPHLYYQLADSVANKEDRRNCASVVADVIAAGLTGRSAFDLDEVRLMAKPLVVWNFANGL